MNAMERRLAGRMYMCLSAMTGLQPVNPSDVAAVSKNLKLSVKASRCLLGASEHLMHREYEAAAEYLGDAEQLLEVRSEEAGQ